MKKIFFFLMVSFLFYTGCVVNEYTGSIHLENISQMTVSNIKLGNTVICLFLTPGAKYDYYFYSNMTGQLTGVGAVTGYYHPYLHTEKLYNGTFYFKTNWLYNIRIENSNQTVYMYPTRVKNGIDQATYDDTEDKFYSE